MTALRTRMLEDLRIRNYAAKTQRVCIRSVSAFARHFGRSPDVLGAEEIRACLVHLRDERKVSWSGFNQAGECAPTCPGTVARVYAPNMPLPAISVCGHRDQDSALGSRVRRGVIAFGCAR
jgi:hypothetical protein